MTDNDERGSECDDPLLPVKANEVYGINNDNIEKRDSIYIIDNYDEEPIVGDIYYDEQVLYETIHNNAD